MEPSTRWQIRQRRPCCGDLGDNDVDSSAADVIYAGAAPGIVTGVSQINLRLPELGAGGVHSVIVRAGAASSKPATIYAGQ